MGERYDPACDRDEEATYRVQSQCRRMAKDRRGFDSAGESTARAEKALLASAS
jgi:hypothetical protein